MRGARSSLSLPVPRWAVLWACACALLLLACAPAKPREAAFTGEISWEELSGIRMSHDLIGDVTLIKAGDDWVTPDGFQVDSVRLAKALLMLRGLHAREEAARVGRNSDLVEQYGLGLEALAIRLDLASGTRVGLRLGSTETDPSATYWMSNGGKSIYRVADNRAFSIAAPPDAWKSRKLTPDLVGERAVQAMTVSWFDSLGEKRFYQLDRIGKDSAFVVAPRPGGIYSRKARELIGRTMQWAIDEFPDSAEVRRVLASPVDSLKWVTVEVTLKDGTSLRFRPVAEADEYYYFTLPSGAMVKLLKWRFRDLTVSLDDLQAEIHDPYPYEDDWGTPPPGADEAYERGLEPESHSH